MSAAISHSIKLSLDDAKGDTIAHVRLFRRNQTWWITDLWVAAEHRKKGLATRLMTEAVQLYGDRVLYLEAQPYTDQPLAIDALTAWYGRFGFVATEVPDVMRRPRGGAFDVTIHVQRVAGTEATTTALEAAREQFKRFREAVTNA